METRNPPDRLFGYLMRLCGYPVYDGQSPRPHQKLIVHTRIPHIAYNISTKAMRSY